MCDKSASGVEPAQLAGVVLSDPLGILERQVSAGNVPAFNYMTLANDHTAGTRPGARKS